MKSRIIITRIEMIAKRELNIFSHRPVFLFCMIIAPLLCIFFFSTLMSSGLPKKLPAAIVDEDDTHITRIIVRVLNSFEETDLKYQYKSFDDARHAIQQGKIYAFFYLPKGTTKKALSSRQPNISFYTNDSYYVPANLLMKDMKTASVLISLALTREKLYAKGATERHAMGIVRPIVVETHPINNPELDYSVYLSNMLVPGIMILLIMLTTTYTIGIEWKHKTQKIWYMMAGDSQTIAITGKLLPQTIIYSILMIFMNVYFYCFLKYPCNGGLLSTFCLSILTVLASQGFGIFLFGLMAGEMRLAMCICSLWGILSFSLAGFTYPVTAMSPVFRALAVWFPLRHYYIIYVNTTLNGYSLTYVWQSLMALIAFCFLPLTVNHRYRKAFIKYHYLR